MSEPVATIKGESVYLNQSRISDFLRCEELYHLTWEWATERDAVVYRGLAPKQVNINLEAGSSYHDGIAHYYTSGRKVEEAVNVCQKRFDKGVAKARPFAEEMAKWDDLRETLAIMIRNYHIKYHKEAIEVLAPEVKGSCQLGTSPHHLVFRTDAVIQRYGTIGLLDYKTKGRTPSSLEIARIHSEIQPTAYIYGVRATTGMKVEGLEYRWAIKNARYDVNRMHLSEWTARTQKDMKRFEDETIDICERILARRKDGKWLHNWNQCTTFGECSMRRICLHHRDPATFGLYDVRQTDYVIEAKAHETTGGD